MSSEAKHTPGPWCILENETTYGPPDVSRLVIEQALGGQFTVAAVLTDFGTDSEHEANASLIAAAPELLEALKDTLRMLEAAHRQLGMYTKDNPRIVKARAAVAKATGAQK